uniref:SFRICE_012635 n=1 Tax=Spodoptera frugiperda TaxID=7108 RepID=A0A2H1VGK7_SPOFR
MTYSLPRWSSRKRDCRATGLGFDSRVAQSITALFRKFLSSSTKSGIVSSIWQKAHPLLHGTYNTNGKKWVYIELRRAIEGLVVMSEMLETMYTCIFGGKTPSFWLRETHWQCQSSVFPHENSVSWLARHTEPCPGPGRPSMKSLGAWCRELFLRGAHLSGWAGAPRAPPTLCWLPAFVAPTGFLTAVMQVGTSTVITTMSTGFLTAVMQTTARGESWPIDTLCWEFTVMPLEEAGFVRPPRDGGVYIRGQYLEGASWFRKDGHLQEPLPMQLVFPMSPIHFKPVRITGKRTRNPDLQQYWVVEAGLS